MSPRLNALTNKFNKKSLDNSTIQQKIVFLRIEIKENIKNNIL